MVGQTHMSEEEMLAEVRSLKEKSIDLRMMQLHELVEEHMATCHAGQPGLKSGLEMILVHFRAGLDWPWPTWLSDC